MKKNLIYSGILVSVLLVSLVSAGWFTGNVVGSKTCDSDAECFGGYCAKTLYIFGGTCKCPAGKTWEGNQCVDACEKAGGVCGIYLDNANNIGDGICADYGCWQCDKSYSWDGKKCLESEVYLVYDNSSTMLDQIALYNLKLSLQLKGIGAEVLENGEVTKDMLKDKLTVFVYEGVATTIKEEDASSLLLVNVLDSMIQIRHIKYNCDTIVVDKVYSDDLISVSCIPKEEIEPIPSVSGEVTYAGVLEMLNSCELRPEGYPDENLDEDCNNLCASYGEICIRGFSFFYLDDKGLFHLEGLCRLPFSSYRNDVVGGGLTYSDWDVGCICCSP